MAKVPKAGPRIGQATKAQEARRKKAAEDKTDWARIDAKTEADIEADIAADPEWKDVPRDWYQGAEAVKAGGETKEQRIAKLEAALESLLRVFSPEAGAVAQITGDEIRAARDLLRQGKGE